MRRGHHHLATIGLLILLLRGESSASMGQDGVSIEDTKAITIEDPILASTGEYTFALPLYQFEGPIGWSLMLRHCPRYLNRPDYHYEYGAGFEHNLPRLCLQGTNCAVENVNDTDEIEFTSSGGVWRVTSDATRGYELRETGTATNQGYVYFLHPDEQRIFGFDKGVQRQLVSPATFLMDRNGNTLRFTTNALGRIGRMSDGYGRWVDWQYASNTTVLVTGMVDHAGRRMALAYTNGNANLERVVMPDGGVHRIAWSKAYSPTNLSWWVWSVGAHVWPRGNAPTVQSNVFLGNELGGFHVRVLWQEDAYGHRSTIAYSNETGRTTVQRSDGSTAGFTHARRATASWAMPDQGPPLQLTDGAGRSINLTTNEHGQLAGLTDRTGVSSSLGWDAATRDLLSVSNSTGAALRYTYADAAQTFTNPVNGETFSFTFRDVTRVDYPDGTWETFLRDAAGNPTQRTDRAGATWRYRYDDAGRPVGCVDPLGGTNGFAYGTNGLLAAARDADGVGRGYAYDTRDRVAAVTNLADGTLRRFEYDNGDRVTNAIDETGRALAIAYDANGNVVRLAGSSGQPIVYEYDLMDRVTNRIDAAGATDRTFFDARGRLARRIGPDGVETRWEFDADDRMTNQTVAGAAWRTRYDAEGAPVLTTDPLGHATGYGLDALGRVAAVTDALGRVTRLGRDVLGATVAVTNAAGLVTRLQRDAQGLVTNRALPGGLTFSTTYDAMGGLRTMRDGRGQAWTFDYTAGGRLKSVTDPLGGVRETTFDARGRVATVQAPGGLRMTNTYDAAGRTTRRAYAGGPDLAFAFDAVGRQTNIAGEVVAYDAAGRVTNALVSGVGFSARYDAAGRLLEAGYSNGAVRVTYAYDPTTGLLTNVTDNVAGGRVGFEYDAAMQLRAVHRGNGLDATDTRDAAGQLTRKQDGAGVDLQFAYDAAGLMTNVDYTLPLDPAPWMLAGTNAGTYDAASQNASGGWAYDAAGRATNLGGTVTLAWDGASQVVRIDGVTLDYDAFGGLVRRSEGAATNRLFHHPALGMRPIVAERDEATGTVRRYYVWTPGGALLYAIEMGGTPMVRYYHFDAVGSTVALSDGGGAVTDRYAYDPAGRLLHHQGPSDQPFTFVGRHGVRRESAGGLYQMGVRYYHPGAGRFLSRDPAWPAVDAPLELNPYAYASANPMQFVDPLGLKTTIQSSDELYDVTAPVYTIGGQEYQIFITTERGLEPLVINHPIAEPGDGSWSLDYAVAQAARPRYADPSEVPWIRNRLVFINLKAYRKVRFMDRLVHEWPREKALAHMIRHNKVRALLWFEAKALRARLEKRITRLMLFIEDMKMSRIPEDRPAYNRAGLERGILEGIVKQANDIPTFFDISDNPEDALKAMQAVLDDPAIGGDPAATERYGHFFK